MFGHKKLLTEGARGSGVVTALRVQRGSQGIGQIEILTFDTRVVFEGGDSVEATFKTNWADWADSLEEAQHGSWAHITHIGDRGKAVFAAVQSRLQPGATVPVRYDPKDRDKVVFDLPALQEEIYAQAAPELSAFDQADAASQDRIARAQAALAAGTDGPASASPGSPAGGLAPQIAAALAGGQLGEIIEQARGARAAGGVDVADELGKLAALRDRGILTADEFEAQKQKLLGS